MDDHLKGREMNFIEFIIMYGDFRAIIGAVFLVFISVLLLGTYLANRKEKKKDE